jgi:hypothetical protein
MEVKKYPESSLRQHFVNTRPRRPCTCSVRWPPGRNGPDSDADIGLLLAVTEAKGKGSLPLSPCALELADLLNLRQVSTVMRHLLEFSRRRYRQLGRDMPWVPGTDGAAVRRYDLGGIAEQAGLSVEELIGMIEQAHALLGEQS